MEPPHPDLPAAPSPALDAWFAHELQLHEPDLRSYLAASFPSVRDVDDVVQESYLRLWRARAGRPLRSVRAFLFRIARNTAVDLVRRAGISPVVAVADVASLGVAAEQPDAGARLTRDELVQALIAAIAELPPRGRQVVLLRKFEQLSQRETAAQLGIAEKTVDEHLSRALRRIGTRLLEQGISRCYER